MRVAICDDHKECNAKLKSMIKNYFRRKNIGSYTIEEFLFGAKLVDSFTLGKYDIIFLDIQMPDVTGEKAAELIRNIDIDVDLVFVTNMSDQSLMGYNYHAKGFLIKEVKQDEIDSLMDRLLNEMNRKTHMGTYPIKQTGEGGVVYLRLSRVLYFESHDKKISVVCDSKNETYEFRSKLEKVEEDLKNKGFIRINRSLLVNVSHIFKDFGDSIALSTGERLEMSRVYKDSVREALRME